MTPAARIVYLLALVIGLSVGALFAFWYKAELLKHYYDGRRFAASSELDDFSSMQYRHADAEHAKTGLLASARLLEKLETLSPETNQKLDLAGTYTHLAWLEDTANNAQASHDYMAKAQYWYAAGGHPGHSDSEIKALFSKRDKIFEKAGIR
ncbi:MAG TPA: hypothetical protein VN982_04590 [Candidatus Dormibacteraeota bacterium]|nr:hypothetical protein [Candidatus Dormibacteraeota bacterium]